MAIFEGTATGKIISRDTIDADGNVSLGKIDDRQSLIYFYGVFDGATLRLEQSPNGEVWFDTESQMESTVFAESVEHAVEDLTEAAARAAQNSGEEPIPIEDEASEDETEEEDGFAYQEEADTEPAYSVAYPSFISVPYPHTYYRVAVTDPGEKTAISWTIR